MFDVKQGLLELWRGDRLVSRHRLEREAFQSADADAEQYGDGEYVLKAPDMKIIVKRRRQAPSAPLLGAPIVVSSTAITVPLAAPSVGTQPIASYTLEHRVSGGAWEVIATGLGIFGVSGFPDTALVPNTTYEYRCKATDESGLESAYSPTVSATTQGVEPPTSSLATTVVLSADSGITPSGSEIVTFGLPIAEGLVTATSQVRVLRNGVEVPIYCGGGLRWHWKDNSYRSVIIQCLADLTAGDVTLTVTNEGRTTADRTLQAFPAGYVQGATDPQGRALYHPRVYALHDRDYVQGTGLLPPYDVPATDGGAEDKAWGYVGLKVTPYAYSGTSYKEAWLFDRPTTLFKLALQFSDATRRKTVLKHAALSKQLYFNYIQTAGVVANTGGRGTFTFPTDPSATAGNADGKYNYTEPAKLALALLGDTTQWDNQLIDDIAQAAAVGWNQSANDDPYDGEFEPFTERAAGLVGLCMVNSWEITGSAYTSTQISTRIGVLKNMQQVPNQFDIDYGWTPMPGYFRHSWKYHEGSQLASGEYAALAPIGATSATITSFLDPADFARIPADAYFYASAPAPVYSQRHDLTGLPVNNGDGTFTVNFTPALASDRQPGFAFSFSNDIPGFKADRAGSSWMSENIHDFLWHAYHCGFGQNDIPTISATLADALDRIGFYSDNNNDGTFAVKPGYSLTPSWRGNNFNGLASYPTYVISDLAPPQSIDKDRLSAYYSDDHCAEMMGVLGVGYYFSGDATVKSRLKYRLDAIEAAVMHAQDVYSGTPYRIINWQNRSMGYRTWKWVEANALPTLSVVNRTVTESDINQTIPVTVQLSSVAAGDVTFDWETVEGTATAGTDFLYQTGSGLIAQGQLSTTISVTIVGDDVSELTEAFTIRLTNITNAVGAT